MKVLKSILLNKNFMSLIIMILIIVIVIFINIKFKEYCVNNGGKLIVGNNGYSCLYEKVKD